MLWNEYKQNVDENDSLKYILLATFSEKMSLKLQLIENGGGINV